MPNQQPNQQLNIDQSASAGQKLSPINWRHNRFLKILGPICIIAFLIYISAFLILLYYKVTAPCTNCILHERVSILANIAFFVELFTLVIIVSGSLLYSSILLFRLKKLDGIDKLFSVIILINFLLTGGVYWWQWYGSSMMEFSHPEYIVSIPKPADETADWQTYRKEEYGFEVKYPKNWTIRIASNEEAKYGKVVFLSSPETQERINKNEIVIYSDLEISFFKDANENIGGSYPGQPKYANLADLLADKNQIIQKTGEINVDGHKAYEVIIGGAGSNFGVMIENNGIYELLFGSAYDRQLNNIERQILSTFKFIK